MSGFHGVSTEDGELPDKPTVSRTESGQTVNSIIRVDLAHNPSTESGARKSPVRRPTRVGISESYLIFDSFRIRKLPHCILYNARDNHLPKHPEITIYV
jgi:hypothetical protein